MSTLPGEQMRPAVKLARWLSGPARAGLWCQSASKFDPRLECAPDGG
jgi:hypothetical protein